MTRVILAIVATLAFALPARSWALSDAEAINIAGRQRMLTQRVLKDHLMIGAQVQVRDARQQLDDAVAKFEAQHLQLRDYAPNPAIRARLDTVERLWLRQRLPLLQPPDPARAEALLRDNLALLDACEAVVQAIELHAGGRHARLVNLSGRQRMLSQKIAKTYIAMSWLGRSPELEQEFNLAVARFGQALTTLEKAPTNTPALRHALRRVRNQWRFAQGGFALGDDGRFVPTVISVTTESILRKMEAITHQYQQLMRARAHRR